MVICIPPLRKRTFEERLYLIKNFFKEESIRLNKEIYVSLNSMRALLSYNCPNNVGQLKSDIQLICAKSYSLYLTNKKYKKQESHLLVHRLASILVSSKSFFKAYITWINFVIIRFRFLFNY